MSERFDHDAGDGLTLHVTRDGAGPPLLLLHGFTGSAATWTPLASSLGARHTTLALDLPGHGGSSAPADPTRYTLDRLAGDLAGLLDAFGVDRVAVLGYSMGGRTALHFALAHPDRVAGLVLESTSPGIENDAERAERVASDAALADEIERDGVEAFVMRWEWLALWASQASLPAEARQRLRAQRLANSARGLANSLRGAGAGADRPVLDQLKRLDVPTLLLAGALDAKFVALGRAMETALPGASLEVVADAGHAVHLERPTELVRLVLRFLDGVARSDARWRGARGEG